MAHKIKNFLIWTSGFVSAFLTVAAAGAVAFFAIPAGVYFNNDSSLISPDVANKSLFNIMMGYENLGLNDFPFVKVTLENLISTYDLGKYIEVDWSQLEGMTFVQMGSDFQGLLGSAIKVTATIDSIGLGEQLGAFGNLDIMNNWDELTPEQMEAIDVTASDFNPALYYYQVEENKYARAYGKDNQLVPGAADKALFYPALRSVNLLDLFSILPSRIGQNKASQLVGVFSSLPEDSLVSKILGDKTISELGSIDPNAIKLTDVIAYQGNEQIFDVLCSAAGVADPQALTVGSLSNINIDNVRLNDVMPKTESNETMYRILCGAAGIDFDNYLDLKIGSLNGLDFDNIALNDVMARNESNATTYKILMAAAGIEDTGDNYKTLTVGMLNNLNYDNIKLQDVMPKTADNESMYNILCSAAGVTPEEITIGSLKSFDPQNVRIADIVPYYEEVAGQKVYKNLDFYALVKGSLGITGTQEEIDARVVAVTLKEVQGLKTDDILLSAVVDYEENKQLFNILFSGCVLEPGDPRAELNKSNFKIGDLHTLDFNKITLSGVLTEPSVELKNLLEDATTHSWNQITVGDLNTLSFGGVHLSTVVDGLDSTLESLLVQATGSASFSDVTIDSLKNFSVDGIKISTVMPTPNATLSDVLSQALDMEYSNITMADLSGEGMDMGRIKLKSVSNVFDNPTLSAILCQGLGGKQEDAITLNDLENFNIESVTLGAFLTNVSDSLKSILTQATGKATFEQVTVGDLSSNFNVGNCALTAFVPYDSNVGLYKCLMDGTGISDPAQIKVSSLDGGFDLNNIKLSTVMESSENAILNCLIEKGTTLGTLSNDIQNLSINEAYGQDVFTVDASKSATGDKYRVETDGEGKVISYTYDASGDHYLNGSGGFWGLISYTVESKDATNGRGLVYKPAETTIANLSGDVATQSIQNSTIYQLIAVGIMEDNGYSDTLKAMSLQQVLDALNNIPGMH